MKKILAMALALTLTCGVMTACGDDASSDSSETTTTAATTTTTTAATTTTAPADDSSTPDEGGDETGAKPISDVSDALLNIENASVTFTAESDISWITMFNEEVGGLIPGEEGYTGNEGILDISVAELDEIPMVKIDQQRTAEGAFNVLKLRMDLGKLFEGQEEKLDTIFQVKIDLVCVANDEATLDDGTTVLVPNWQGGAWGTNNNGEWNGNMADWSIGEYVSEWGYSELMIRPGIMSDAAKFSANHETNYIALQQWVPSHDIDLYIADVVFLDEAGEVITVD